MSTSNTLPLHEGPFEGRVSSQTLFGHPTGLFTLFFAEMWERFSFYGMKALLLFYMIKGFLKFSDDQAYGVYAAYTALVYTAPFIGGMLADRLLGQRRAVIIGGLLMAAGHLLMTIETGWVFFTALALLVCGNGFFKPNISAIVGSLYPKESRNKDAGFTIFYMGINLGAAMAPIICGYVGETYGWHYGFGLATIGMLIGVAVFAAPTRLTQAFILAGAVTSAIAMPFLQDSPLQLFARIVLALALLAAGIIAVVALNRGGLPAEAGMPPDPSALRRKLGGVLRQDWAVYLGILASVPIVALLVTRDTVAGTALLVTGGAALAYVFYDALFRCHRIERDRVFVILILMTFSLLFWAFFEQSASSVNNFTDRNIDRVTRQRVLSQADVGSTITFRIPRKTDRPELAQLPPLTQAQLGYPHGDGIFTMSDLARLRERAAKPEAPSADQTLAWPVREAHVGMVIGANEIPASEFQAVNPVYILTFGLVFTTLWGFLARRNRDPSTPFKFSIGLGLLTISFGVLWYATHTADSRGMVSISWLLLFYLFLTTGELCLSPVGLSMVTRLSPARIVSTMMGAWFLATAVSQWMAGQIAKLTAVNGEGGGPGGIQYIPPPAETVHLYGRVYFWIAIAAGIATLACFALTPLLKRWEHAGEEIEAKTPAGAIPVQQAS